MGHYRSGKLANKFARDLSTVAQVELVAVAFRSPQKEVEFAVKFNSKKPMNPMKN
jgi:hypothetical protein